MDDFTWTEEGTLYSEQYGDIYYGDGQGLEETEFVFLGGNHISQRLEKDSLVIGELGFGTGLNFLTTWRAWLAGTHSHRLTFISCEKHPLDRACLEKAHENFPGLEHLSHQLRKKLPPIKTGFHFLEFEEGQVSLLLMYGDAVDTYKRFEGKVDAWYLDGFGPSKNPEMWSSSLFKQMARHSHDKTTLATFTAAGFVRRGLAEEGFSVRRVKGFGKKRHMTVGQFSGHNVASPVLPPWFRNPPKKRIKTVAVIGAGIAGLNVAHSLARLGIDVTVFDKNSEVAAEASGNRWGMMYPLITKKIDRLGTLTKSGCAFTRNQLQNLNLTIKEGLLEYATDEGKVKRLEQGLERLPKDYIKQLSANDITSEFSFDSAHGAVYHQQAATFSPKDYCQILLESKLFKCELDSELEELTRLDENWQLKFLDGREEKFDSVVLATAYATKNFAATEHLPLRVTRGQVASIPKEAVNQDVKTGLNFVNYLVQDGEDDYVLGATFQVDDHGQDFRPEDNVELLESIQKFFPGLVKDLDPLTLSGRVCFRAVLKDYFPLVGPVCDLETYKETFEAIKFGRPKHQYDEPPYKEGLYVLAGLGARGLSTASLLGTYLARLIVDGVSILPEEHITATHPSRFILKELKKS